MCGWRMKVHVPKLKPEEKIFRWTSRTEKYPSWIIIFLVLSSYCTIHYSLNRRLSFLYVLISWVQFMFLKYVSRRFVLLVTVSVHGSLLTALCMTFLNLHDVESSFLSRFVSTNVIPSSALGSFCWHLIPSEISHSPAAEVLWGSTFFLFDPSVWTKYLSFNNTALGHILYLRFILSSEQIAIMLSTALRILSV